MLKHYNILFENSYECLDAAATAVMMMMMMMMTVTMMTSNCLYTFRTL